MGDVVLFRPSGLARASLRPEPGLVVLTVDGEELVWRAEHVFELSRQLVRTALRAKRMRRMQAAIEPPPENVIDLRTWRARRA